jgi:Right handed beta helix region
MTKSRRNGPGFVVALAAIWVTNASSAVAASEVRVAPGSDLAALVTASPPGTAFVLLPGTHYAGDIAPKDGQTFEGTPGAILSGAVPVGPFSPNGALWKAKGPPPLSPSHGTCGHHRLSWSVGPDACLLREALFLDGAPLTRVLATTGLREGMWYQDRRNGEVYLGFDPGNRLLEMSYRETAFYGAARDVTIRGLTIQQYASPAQRGAIHGFDLANTKSSSGWTIINNEIRYNSGVGVRTGDLMMVRSNRFMLNGQLGIGGFGEGVVVESNDIVGNNTHGFSSGWEAGGTKFVHTRGLIFARNCVRDNKGPGIWTDIENVAAVIGENSSIGNSGAGIFHEISGRAVIAGNISALNGFEGNSPWSSQIIVSGSIDTLVWRNVVRVPQNSGNGIFVVEEGRKNEDQIIHKFPDYVSRGNTISQNAVTFIGTAGASGFVSTHGSSDHLASVNRFEDNDIVVLEGEERRFQIGGERMDLAEARARGQELRSRIARSADTIESASAPACQSNIR